MRRKAYSTYKPQLEQLLDRELELIGQLTQFLERERAALTQLDPQALDQASEDKRRCIAALDDLENERRHQCGLLGFATDTAGMEFLLARCDDNGSLTERWQLLLAGLRECRAANQANGALVAGQRQRVSDTLSLLRGGSAGPRVYGRDGKSSPADDAKPLASA